MWVFQMRKLRPREVNTLAQGHPTSGLESSIWHPSWGGPLLTFPMAALLSGSADLASGLPLSAEFGSPQAELEPTASVPRRSGFWAGHRQAAEAVEKFAIPRPGRAGPDLSSLAKRRLAVEAGRGREALPGPSMACLGEEGWAAIRRWAKIRVKSV